MQVERVLETCLYVNDLEAAEEFYRRVLGLAAISREPGRHVFFRCGSGVLLLFDPAASSQATSDVPPHGARGSGHAAFAIAKSDVPAWRGHLARSGVPIETELEWPAGGHSIYFRDPAGNSLELVTPEIWQSPPGT